MKKVVFLFLSLELVSGFEDCEEDWYGETCKLRCNCMEGDFCNSKAECIIYDDICARGYFEERCQNYDVMTIANVSIPLLTDNDHESCLDNLSVKTVQIELAYSIYFTFLRLVVLEDELFDEDIINITFRAEDGTVLPCYNETDFRNKADKEDIFCDDPKRIKAIYLSWQADRLICTIYVNGGRNMALGRSPKKLATDGSRKTSLQECYIETGDQTISWEIQFKGPVYLHLVIITGRFAEEGLKMRGFTLSVYEPDGQVVYNFTDDPKLKISGDQYFINIPAYLSPPIQSLKISFNESKISERSLVICEIEALGDCFPGTYGESCDEDCPPSCGGNTCDYSGNCLWCLEGYLGEKCAQFISNDSLETSDTNLTKSPSPVTTEYPSLTDSGDMVMNYVFICLHVVFGSTIVAVIIAFVLLLARNASSKPSSHNSLAPPSLSGSYNARFQCPNCYISNVFIPKDRLCVVKYHILPEMTLETAHRRQIKRT